MHLIVIHHSNFGSVAYSTRGDTTLGDLSLYVDEVEAEEVKVVKQTWCDASIANSSIGSTDSQDWGIKATDSNEKTRTDTGDVIDNLEMLDFDDTLDAQAQLHIPRSMEDLHLELARLRASNEVLAAAALAATTQGSHPLTPPPNIAGAKGEKGGGDD